MKRILLTHISMAVNNIDFPLLSLKWIAALIVPTRCLFVTPTEYGLTYDKLQPVST